MSSGDPSKPKQDPIRETHRQLGLALGKIMTLRSNLMDIRDQPDMAPHRDAFNLANRILDDIHGQARSRWMEIDRVVSEMDAKIDAIS